MKTYDDLYRELTENSAVIQENILTGQKELAKRGKKSEENIKEHVTADGDKTRELIKDVLVIGKLTSFQNIVSFLLSIGTAAYLFFYWFTNEFFGKNVWTTQTVDGMNKNIATYQMDIASTIILPVLIGITIFLISRMIMAWWNTTKYSKNNRKEKEAAKNDQ